jgi:hypothetical protein
VVKSLAVTAGGGMLCGGTTRAASGRLSGAEHRITQILPETSSIAGNRSDEFGQKTGGWEVPHFTWGVAGQIRHLGAGPDQDRHEEMTPAFFRERRGSEHTEAQRFPIHVFQQGNDRRIGNASAPPLPPRHCTLLNRQDFGWVLITRRIPPTAHQKLHGDFDSTCFLGHIAKS